MRDAKPWWTWLGYLLPSDVRERVYEPACYDRLDDLLESHGPARARMGLYAINAFLGTAGRNFPRIWFDGRSLSGLGRLAVGISLTAISYWVLQFVRYAYTYW